MQIEKWLKQSFEINTDPAQLQIAKIHRFLSQEAYWSLDIPFQTVEKAIKGSRCFGVFDRSNGSLEQIGFARVISDGATFAWLCDVYIEQQCRGLGLSKWLMESLMSHPALIGLRRVCLATKDAHKLYEKYGFEVTATPGNWLEIKDNDLYKKQKDQSQISSLEH